MNERAKERERERDGKSVPSPGVAISGEDEAVETEATVAGESESANPEVPAGSG